MPILDTHISGEQLGMPRQVDAGKPFRQVAAVAKGVGEFQAKMEGIRLKNKVDTATIGFKSGLKQIDSDFELNKTTFDERNERAEELQQSFSGDLPPNGQGQFALDTELARQESSVKAQALDYKNVITEQKVHLDQELTLNREVNPLIRIPQIYDKVHNAVRNQILTRGEGEERIAKEIGGLALYDATGFNAEGEPMFDEVMAKVADLKDRTYPLDGKQREDLYKELASQKKMVGGQREDEAVGAFVDIMAEKMDKEIPMDTSDAYQFKKVVGSKQLMSFLKIVQQSKSEERTATRFEQTQLDFYRGEAKRAMQDPAMQKQFPNGFPTPGEIENNPNVPEEAKKELMQTAKELGRLQRIEEFETDVEVAEGTLDANLDKYSRDSLIIKLATDPYLKTLSSDRKRAVIEKHKRVIAEGQGFRSKKDWGTAYGNLLEFRDNGGFVGGWPETDDQAVMDRAVLNNKQEFAKAERAFLSRSEFSFRDYDKNPNQEAPDYNAFSENEMHPYRVKEEENAVIEFVKDIAAIWSPMAGKKIIEERAIELGEQKAQAEQREFETSPETQEFEAYMAEKEQIAQGAVSNAIGKPKTQNKLDEGLLQKAVEETGANQETVSNRLTDSNFGLRHDKSGYKGMGFLGDLQDGKGTHMTEFSLGTEIDGKAMEIPSIVPTLTKDEIKTIVDDKTTTDAINKKAYRYAEKRLAEGKSVWASDADRKEEILKRTTSSEEELQALMKHYNKSEEEVLNSLMRSYLKE